MNKTNIDTACQQCKWWQYETQESGQQVRTCRGIDWADPKGYMGTTTTEPVDVGCTLWEQAPPPRG